MPHTIETLLARTVSVGECRLWTGALCKGYGSVWFDGRSQLVHRVIYELTRGVKLDSSQLVCHSCDTTRCCRPEHLWIGTHADNLHDAYAKGRKSPNAIPRYARARGLENAKARHPDAVVRGVRDHFAEHRSMASAAKAYGVTYAAAKNWITGRTRNP